MKQISQSGENLVSLDDGELEALEILDDEDIDVETLERLAELDADARDLVDRIIDLASDTFGENGRLVVNEGKAKHLILSLVYSAEGSVTNSELVDGATDEYKRGTVTSATSRLFKGGYITRQLTDRGEGLYEYLVTAKGQRQIDDLGLYDGVEEQWDVESSGLDELFNNETSEA